MVHVSGVFTQISPLTLDVTTNKYFYSAAGNAKYIFEKKKITIILSRPPHTLGRNNSPNV